jgi:hypothetical protein
MTTVGLHQPVRYNGEVTTIDALSKRGRIEFTHVPNLNGRRNAYFADIKNSGGLCFEISEAAYLSRTGQQDALASKFGTTKVTR